MPHIYLLLKYEEEEESLVARGLIFVKGHERPLSVFEHVVVVVVVFVGELIPKDKRDARRRRVTRTFSQLAAA